MGGLFLLALRWLAALVALVAVSAIAGTIYQYLSETADLRRYPHHDAQSPDRTESANPPSRKRRLFQHNRPFYDIRDRAVGRGDGKVSPIDLCQRRRTGSGRSLGSGRNL